jgi:hypothetical protein
MEVKEKNIETEIILEDSTTEEQKCLKFEFQSIITSYGKTLSELSQEHTLVLFFIKWFGCPLCQEVIYQIGHLLPSLLKLNTIPVIVHQQKDEAAESFIKKSRDLNVPYLAYAKTTKDLQELIGIKSAPIMAHMGAMKEMIELVCGEKRRKLEIPYSVNNPLSQFGVITIANDLVKKKIIYSSLEKRVDFGMLLQQQGQSSAFSEDYLTKILKYYPDYDYKTDFKRVAKERKSTMRNKKKTEDPLTLQDVLESDIGRYYFKAFAVSEYSIENLLLYEEVLKYTAMKDKYIHKVSEQLELAKHIVNYYLLDSSPMQVNIQQKLANNAMQAIEDFEKEEKGDLDSVFDEIISDVKKNCLNDTFARFLSSKHKSDYDLSVKQNKAINYFI